MKAIKEHAYAKINLFLDVVDKRNDGFHGIRTVMQTVSLCDTVTVELSPSKKKSVYLKIDGNTNLHANDKNLVVIAANTYMDIAGITASLNIRLTKNIPIAAGLAGGSADAAATLRAMNKLFGRHFTDKALLSIAEKIGSDVPYCLVGGTALCEGRGEIITRLPSLNGYHIVIAVADEYVSTPAAYSTLDGIYSDFDGSVKSIGAELIFPFTDSVSDGTLNLGAFYNIFESAVLPTCPKALAVKEKMTGLGAKASLMSGSGPSVFGIFSTSEVALAARDALLKDGYRAYAAEFV